MMNMNLNTPRLGSLSSGASEQADVSIAPPAGIAPRAGQVVCGDIDMRIDSNGLWHHNGSPIGRKELVKLFATVLRRDEAGDHWLITPAEMARIQVDDAPFMIVEMMVDGGGEDQIVSFRTNIETWVTVDADHPLRVDIHPETGEPSPYVLLDNGDIATGGGLEAKLNRAVYYDLVSISVEELIGQAHIFGIWSGGEFFAVGRMEDEHAG